MAHTPEQLRAIAQRLGGPLMYLSGRGGLAGLGMSLGDLGGLGYRIVADPSTPLLAGLRGVEGRSTRTWSTASGRAGRGASGARLEKEMLDVIELDKLLAIERATVEK